MITFAEFCLNLLFLYKHILRKKYHACNFIQQTKFILTLYCWQYFSSIRPWKNPLLTSDSYMISYRKNLISESTTVSFLSDKTENESHVYKSINVYIPKLSNRFKRIDSKVGRSVGR